MACVSLAGERSCVPRLLEVAADASAADIKSAYRRKALQLHPDVNAAADAAERFTEVSNAYGALYSFAPDLQ